MNKLFLTGIILALLSFFVVTAFVQAQTATPSPTPSTSVSPTTMPGGAPQTGFGN